MALSAELKTQLSQDLERNRKNGYSSKTMKLASDTFELENKILSLFAFGNSYSQIADHIEDMYGVHLFKPAIAAIFESCKNKWDNLSNYFKYVEPIRKVIYTTNIKERLKKCLRFAIILEEIRC